MNAEELIKALQELVAQHGNLYVENEDGEGVTVEFNDEGSDVIDQYLRCDGCKQLFDNVEDVINHAESYGERGCQCIPHATCGHRVRWTGAIDDGELILGTGCWQHVYDSHGNLQAPRER